MASQVAVIGLKTTHTECNMSNAMHWSTETPTIKTDYIWWVFNNWWVFNIWWVFNNWWVFEIHKLL